jgi:hypothetical protein
MRRARTGSRSRTLHARFTPLALLSLRFVPSFSVRPVTNLLSAVIHSSSITLLRRRSASGLKERNMNRNILAGLTLSASLAMGGVYAPVSHAIDSKTFLNPTGPDGIPLDVCINIASQCLYTAARYFCNVQGYDTVTNYHENPDAGYTQTITGQICSGWCGSFTRITCHNYIDRDLGSPNVDEEDEEQE